VHKVGHLQELYEVAWSTEHKNKIWIQTRNLDRFKIVCSHIIEGNSAVLTFRKTGFKSKLGNNFRE
jgi:hypothetical protein